MSTLLNSAQVMFILWLSQLRQHITRKPQFPWLFPISLTNVKFPEFFQGFPGGWRTWKEVCFKNYALHKKSNQCLPFHLVTKQFFTFVFFLILIIAKEFGLILKRCQVTTWTRSHVGTATTLGIASSLTSSITGWTCCKWEWIWRRVFLVVSHNTAVKWH